VSSPAGPGGARPPNVSGAYYRLKMAYVGLEHSLFYSSHSTLRMWSAAGPWMQVPGRTLDVAGL
jgi:hypothetical protein